MEFIIRPIRYEDANDVNELRRMEGVRDNLYAIPSERVTRAENMIKNLGKNDHLFVAEVKEKERLKVVGMVGMSTDDSPRSRHVGSLGIMVRDEYTGKGVGTALLKEIINLADNYLMIKRLELEVFEENKGAKKLYERMGFVVEGKKLFAAVRKGRYANQYIMARYNDNI